eukprot:4099157-Prymnesium_polylepis.2
MDVSESVSRHAHGRCYDEVCRTCVRESQRYSLMSEAAAVALPPSPPLESPTYGVRMFWCDWCTNRARRGYVLTANG